MSSGGPNHHNLYFEGVVHNGLGSLGGADNINFNNKNNSTTTTTTTTPGNLGTNQPTSMYQHYNQPPGLQSSPSFVTGNNSEFNPSNQYFPQQSISQSQPQQPQQPSIQQSHQQIIPPLPQSRQQQGNHNYNHMQNSSQQQLITPYGNSQNAINDDFDYFSYEGSISVPSSKIDHPYYQELNFNINDIDLNLSIPGIGNQPPHQAPDDSSFHQQIPLPPQQFHFDNIPAVDQHIDKRNELNFQPPTFNTQSQVQHHHQQSHHVQHEHLPPQHQISSNHIPQVPVTDFIPIPQVLPQFQDSNIKRKLSSSQLNQVPLKPPAKAKPSKPPTIRQSSMPIISGTGSRVTSKSSHKPSSNLAGQTQDVFADTDLWDNYMADNSDIPLFNANTDVSTGATATKLTTSKSTNQSSSLKNPRGRPRKGKKNPGFFLKLDSIKSDHLLNKSNEISSSQSDSGIYSFDNLKNFTPTSTLFNFNDDRVLEQDLTDLQKFPSNKSIITPSHRPPTSGNSYFELEIFANNSDDQGNLISPRLKYNEGTFDNFNQSFEQYLDTPKDLNATHLASSDNNSSASPFNHVVLKIKKESSAPAALIPSQTVSSSFDSHVSSFKDTPHPVLLNAANNSSLPHLNVNDDLQGSDSDEEDEQSSDGEEDDDDEVIKGENAGFLSIGDIRPNMERTGSNQSVSSGASVSSNKENTTKKEKTKKKKIPKGAVCPVCDKFISRDLTRHMRIHNAVGRFQCVYPKVMCKHKTQYFNRPYDYKKHLLHMHFKFDDPKGKTAITLTDKLPLEGTCIACGVRFIANDWLEGHVLATQSEHKCPFVEDKDPGS